MNTKTTRAPVVGAVPSPGTARRRSHLVPTLATIVGVVVFVMAGNWQRGRMEQKQALQAQYEAAGEAAPSGLPVSPADWSALRYRRVQLEGRFDAGHQILIDNRVHQGRAGYHVVTPLVLDDGRAVLVNRGWAAAATMRSEIPMVPPPAGPVTVRGRIALPVEGLRLAGDAPRGVVWQHLDPVAFAAASGVRVAPVVVLQSAVDAPGDGLARDWPDPDFGIDKHRIYMVQWYLFAALAIGLWGWYVLRPRLLGKER